MGDIKFSDRQKRDRDLHNAMREVHALIEQATEKMVKFHPTLCGHGAIIDALSSTTDLIENNDAYNHQFPSGIAFDVTLSSTRRIFARSREEATALAQEFLISTAKDAQSAICNLDDSNAVPVPTSDHRDCFVSWYQKQQEGVKK